MRAAGDEGGVHLGRLGGMRLIATCTSGSAAAASRRVASTPRASRCLVVTSTSVRAPAPAARARPIDLGRRQSGDVARERVEPRAAGDGERVGREASLLGEVTRRVVVEDQRARRRREAAILGLLDVGVISSGSCR